MPRNMSFALTTEQVLARTKTQTRRFGWRFLNPGDVLNAVEKSMGIPRGGKIKRLCQIRVLRTHIEPLSAITREDVIAEGFPDWSPAEFVLMMVNHNRCASDKPVNVIEFEYVDANPPGGT